MRARSIKSFKELSEVKRTIFSSINKIRDVEKLQTRKAIGRVIAGDLRSPSDRPPRHTSHMDGYAVRASDTKGASKENPKRLRVLGWIGPAETGSTLAEGSAFRIHTGGYLPDGADAVIPQEDAGIRDNEIEIYREYEQFEHVDRKGVDVRAGQVVVERGELLSPVKAALLESVGVYEVEVVRRPKIGLLAFGSELTERPEDVTEGKVLNTFSPVVARMLSCLGCEVLYRGIVPDDYDVARDKLLGTLEESDGLLTIGSSSVGDVDVLWKVLSEVSDVFVQGLKLQPGRVGGFASIKGKPIILLPGLIHSTVNVFNYLAAPTISFMSGLKLEELLVKRKAKLGSTITFEKWKDFVKVVWVRLSTAGETLAEPLTGESSKLSSIAFADGYIEVNSGVEVVKEGEEVEVMTPLWMKPLNPSV